MNRRFLALSVAAAAAGLAAWLYQQQNGPPSALSRAPRRAAASPTPAHPAPYAFNTPVPTPAMSPLQAEIESLLAKLLAGKATSLDLAKLRQKLLHANPAEAMAAISAFLASGRDATTGSGFAIGSKGALTEAPTLRTFLLDLLGQIAQGAGSNVADTISRQILDQKTSPEEWALALRNVAWSEPLAVPYLANKMREMLGYQPWLSQGSPGFLEAFDIVVYSGDPSLIPSLANMASGGLPAEQRAAVIALDRLSETSPLAVMNYLNSNPGQLADLPYLRADYFAKADLGQPQQVAALENYLTRVDVTLPEKTKLINALATPASFISDGLLSSPPVDNSAARLQELPGLYQQWLAANRFPALQGPMQQVLAQLAP